VENALLQMLTARGGPLSSACLRWLVDGDGSALRPAVRVDVRMPAPGDPSPF
jgi:hypothetical protein